MNNPPLVSYAVITHDRPPDVVRARIINSILNQDYPRKELLLIGENCACLDEIAAGLVGS